MSDSESKKYNGWTNYETWNYALWLDNEEGTQTYWNDMAQEAYDRAEADEPDAIRKTVLFSRKDNAAFALRDQMKDEAEEFVSNYLPESLKTCWLADAVNAYLSEVNWYEIAEHFLSDVEEEEEAE